MILLIIAIILAIVSLVVYFNMKRLRYGNLTLITGGVKTGKTQLAVALAVKTYRKQYRKWKRACRRARRRFEPIPEQPLLYSNMPIGKPGMKYVPLTTDMILRKVRLRYGSVVLLNEVTFIAGSADFKSDEVNEALLAFFKLCAHELRGGYVFCDTQAPQDLHFAVKRSLSTYYHIYRRVTLPLVSLLWMRENMLVDGEHTVALDTQTDTQDTPSEGGKKLYFRLVLNKWWKYYDRYSYSSLTDSLPVADGLIEVKSQKIGTLVRVKHYIERMVKNGKK